jgi:transposase
MIAVGVDTHKHEHLARAIDGLGQVLGALTITTSLRGYGELARWLRTLGEGVVVGIEGAGSYGAGLCEYLLAEGFDVVEVERPRREDRRRGKSDEIDALLAAKKVLAADGLSTPRAGGTRQALAALLIAQRSCISERTRLVNQLQSLPGQDARSHRRTPKRAAHLHGAARPCPPRPRTRRSGRRLQARAHRAHQLPRRHPP